MDNKKIVYIPNDEFFVMVLKNEINEYEVICKSKNESSYKIIITFSKFELAKKLCDDIYSIYEDGYIDGYNGN